MEKRYDVLEFYKIVNELIDLSRLENTKEKFLDIDIIKEKSTLDKELMLMGEMIDFYKYDDGFELAGLSDIQRFMRNVEVIGSYLSSEDLANLKRNLTIFRVSKSRAKNVRDKYKNIWQLFANIEEVKDIEQFIDDAVREDAEDEVAKLFPDTNSRVLKLKKAIFKAYLDKTKDFRTSIFGEE